MATKIIIKTEGDLFNFRESLKKEHKEKYKDREFEILVNINKNLPQGYSAIVVYTDGKGIPCE